MFLALFFSEQDCLPFPQLDFAPSCLVLSLEGFFLRQEDSLTALLKSAQLEKLDLFDCQQLSCSNGAFAALEGQQLQSLKLLV